MSDYIKRSALIESIKAEVQCVEKEKQQYFEQGNFHNGNILVEKIQAMKLAMKIVANEPTISETEIIRKVFDRVLEKLEREKRKYEKAEVEYKDTFSERNYRIRKYTAEALIEIVKEECGISE